MIINFKKQIKVVVLLLLVIVFALPWLNAKEVKSESFIASFDHTKKIIDANELTEDHELSIAVDQSYAYLLSTDASEVTINSVIYETPSIESFIPSINNLDIKFTGASYATLLQSQSQVEQNAYDVSSIDTVEFDYVYDPDVTVNLYNDANEVVLVDGHNIVDTSNSTALTVKTYAPLNPEINNNQIFLNQTLTYAEDNTQEPTTEETSNEEIIVDLTEPATTEATTRGITVSNGSNIPNYMKDDVVSVEQVTNDMGTVVTSSDDTIVFPDQYIDTSVPGLNLQLKFKVSELVSGSTKDVTVKYNVYDGAIPPADYGFADKGDAPASYGEPTIYTYDAVYDDVFDGPYGFYLGMDAPFFDMIDDTDPIDKLGLDDDNIQNDPDGQSFDDETGFLYNIQDKNGVIQFDVSGPNLYLTVPYTNTDALPGQIGIWFDFDQSGTFDSDEFFSQPIEPTGGVARIFGSGNNQFFQKSASFVIPIPSDIILGDTYMRAIITNDTADISAMGGESDLSRGEFIGEIEDYPINFNKKKIENTCSEELPTTPNLAWSTIEYGNPVTPPDVVGVDNGYDSLKYVGIPGPFGLNIDLVITTNDGLGTDSIAFLTDSTQYSIDPDGLVFSAFNDNRGIVTHIKMETFISGTDIPVEVPLQVRIYGLRSKGNEITSDNIEITNMNPVPMDIWYEGDTILANTANHVWPEFKTDNYSFLGSINTFAYSDNYSSVHEFDMDIDYHGGVGVSLSWPTLYQDFTCTPPIPDTIVTKSISSESGVEPGILENGETITYQVTVENPSDLLPATAISIRDSLLEDLPTWMTYDGIVNVAPSTVSTSGSLTNGSFVINEIQPLEVVTLTYSVTVSEIPPTVKTIGNLVTNSGDDPSTITPEVCFDTEGCDYIDIKPETTITKAAKDFNDDGQVDVGEVVSYTITITNPSDTTAYNVAVRDSLYEQIISGAASYASINQAFTLSPVAPYTGSLDDGTLVISEIPPLSSVKVIYKIRLDSLPTDTDSLVNIATDNGTDPSLPELICVSDDCGSTVLPIVGDSHIEKKIFDESFEADGIAEAGEEITYKIDVINYSASNIYDVPVRDSIAESALTNDLYDVKDFSIILDPVTATYTGDLTAGTFKIDEIPAGETISVLFTIVINDVATEAVDITNWATDNGQRPALCTIEDNINCASATIDLNPATSLEKSLISESVITDGIAEEGEDLTYQISIINDSLIPAKHVPVRDSLLESPFVFVDWDGNFTINPSTLTYTGSLADGTFVLDEVPPNTIVTITYTISITTYPDEATGMGNIATDDGSLPEYPCPPTSDDCAITINPVEPETIVEKTVVDATGDGVATVGEELTYTIKAINLTPVDAYNTQVRDSLLEQIGRGEITYLSIVPDSLTVVDQLGNPVSYTGDLTAGTFMIDNLTATTTVDITYKIRVDRIPNDVSEIINIATDDGTNPETCTDISTDCAGTITPVEPGTTITKTVTDGDDNIAVRGDVLSYTVTVTNKSNVVTAHNVNVKDSMLMNQPAYLHLLSASIGPAGVIYTGLLEEGDITIHEIAPGKSVTITYNLLVLRIPNDIASINNVATDNGTDPTTVDPETCFDEECSSTNTDVNPEPVISKAVVDSNGNDVVEVGDTLTYTISVTNPGLSDTSFVHVRDSIAEQFAAGTAPVGVIYNDDLTITSSGVELLNPDDYTGDLKTANLIINSIAPGEIVEISYTVSITSTDDFETVRNVVTDNDNDPTTIDTCLEVLHNCDVVELPAEPDTLIEKTVSDASGDNKLQVGERVDYTITVTNPGEVSAYDILVRDSLLESLPSFVSLTTPVVVTPETIITSGDLTTTGLVISEIPAGTSAVITYSLTLDANPIDGTSQIGNIATDDGSDPSLFCDPASEECSETIIPVDGDTEIEKHISSESGIVDGVAESRELIEYTVTVKNNTTADAYDVVVKDSMIASLPPYITEIDDEVVTPSDIPHSGHLSNSTGLVFPVIPAGEVVTIKYVVQIGDIPADVETISNIVTDNGGATDLICADPLDCDEVVIPVRPDTTIAKTATDDNADGILQKGESINYEITVTNPSTVDATNVIVKDSLLQNLDPSLRFNNDVVLSIDGVDLVLGTDYVGDLTTAYGITIANIPAGKTVTITYSITLKSIPEGELKLLNIATDDGSNPTIIDPEVCIADPDCGSITYPIAPETTITKAVSGLDADGFARVGDTLTYSIAVTNESATQIAYNVHIRDSILESIPTWLTYNNDIALDPPTTAYTGDLTTGNLTINEINPSETITITYSFVLNALPTDSDQIKNIATDSNNIPPVCFPGSLDCAQVITPVDAESSIEKFVTDSDLDGIAEVGDTLNYTIKVSNDDLISVHNVPVHDVMVQNPPTWLKFNSDVSVAPAEIVTTGDLALGTFEISEIPPTTEVYITYSFDVTEIPRDEVEVKNIVTNDGTDTCLVPVSETCDSAVIVTEGDTIISKSVYGLDDGIAHIGDEIRYAIVVTNDTDSYAHNINVRDSLLEDLPPYLKYNGDFTVMPATSTSGSIVDGTYTIDQIAPGASVTLDYSFTLIDLPNDVSSITNITTDDSSDPSVIDPAVCVTRDCDVVDLVVSPDTIISKTVSGDDIIDGHADKGDVLNYQIEVTNTNLFASAYNVAIRDNLLENLPAWLTFSNDVTVTPIDISYEGSLVDGTFVIEQVPPNTTVTVDYSIIVDDIPTDAVSITNVATDNGSIIGVCLPGSTNCGATQTAVNADTTIAKTATIEGGKSTLAVGDTITYQIDITNISSMATAFDIAVRDNLVESTPSYLTFNDDVIIAPLDTLTTGTLAGGDLVIDHIDPSQTITITYSMTLNELPADETHITNVVYDDGSLLPFCPPLSDFCSSVLTPIEGDTSLTKTVTDTNGNYIAEVGETLNYTILLENPNSAPMNDVLVRDTLLENTPTWMTYNADLAVTPAEIKYSGSITDGTFVIDQIPGTSTIHLTYSMNVNSIPTDVAEITNIATNDGTDTCPDTTSDSCDDATIDVEGETAISKSSTTDSTNEFVSPGDTITYTLTVANNTYATAHDVIVRDNITENLPSWVRFNNDVVVNPKTVPTTGSLTAGDFTILELKPFEVVTITYSVKIISIPDDVSSIYNVITDDGSDPATVDPLLPGVCTDDAENCGIAVDVVDPETIVNKSVSGIEDDGVANIGDTLVYTIDIKNPNTVTSAHDVPVRDSLVEAQPTWLQFNNDITINPDTTVTSGSLVTGDFVIDEIATNSTISITYSFTVKEIPNDESKVKNVATDDGSLIDICTFKNDCSSVVVNLDPETTIEKSVSGLPTLFVGAGDTMQYTITVTNPNTVASAVNVPVRDSLLENMPTWLTYNGDFAIDPSTTSYSGDITLATLVINQIPPNSSVDITYSVTMTEVPTDEVQVKNIATDNGNLVPICLPSSTNCSSVVTPIDGETSIEKAVVDSDGDNVAEAGDTLTYTVKITNPDLASNNNVAIRDTLVETPEAWLSYNDDMTIDPPGITYTGSLQTGDMVIDEVPGESEIYITYSFDVLDIPKTESQITNIVTNDGTDVCLDPLSDSCAIATIDVEGDVVVDKTVTGLGIDNIVQTGETLVYNIAVTNDTAAPAHNVSVRDSLLENLPAWLRYNNDLLIEPELLTTTGSLANGTFSIERINPGETVNITYSLTVLYIPDDVDSLANVVVDDETDPSIVDPDVCLGDDCDAIVSPIEPDTIIAKTYSGIEDDGYANIGDTINFTITVTNPNTLVSATNVVVRDYLIEATPAWLTYNGDMTLTPPDTITTGDLTTSNFTITEIAPGASVNINYSMTVNDIPADAANIDNIATDDGNMPSICYPSSLDCAETIIDLDPETTLTKHVNGVGLDGYVESGDTIRYILEVRNASNEATAHDILIRDSLLENLPTWMTYNDDLTINPAYTIYTGSLQDGTFTLDHLNPGSLVVIQYTITIGDIPNDADQIVNILTDDDKDPATVDPEVPGVCDSDDDCAITITDVNPDTKISKSVSGLGTDGMISNGETVTYSIDVTNKSTVQSAKDVAVRDNLLENLPIWITFDSLTVSPVETITSGSLIDGNFVISEIAPATTITITYDLTFGEIPSTVDTIANVVTDNGKEPETCPFFDPDCSSTITSVNPETTIVKTVLDLPTTGYLSIGDTITYQLAVTNTSEVAQAQNILVRDGLIESTPAFMTFNDDVVIDPTSVPTTGSLTDGTYVITTLGPSQTMTITYSFTMNKVPPSGFKIVNVATDNGLDPTVVDPETCIDDDCSSEIVPINGEPVVEKEVVDSTLDGIVQVGDTLDYTLIVRNEKEAAAHDVAIRDTLLENIPTWLELTTPVEINPNTLVTSGDLQTGDFMIDYIPGYSQFEITYSFTVLELPPSISEVENIVTNDGTDTCPDETAPSCDIVVLPVAGDTTITKAVTGIEDDGLANIGDVLTYEINVVNSTLATAYNVSVRDSLLENMPAWLELATITIDPTTLATTGDLTTGDFVITEIAPSSIVTITYDVTILEPPADADDILNVVVDDGSDPTTVDPDVCTTDCDSIIVEIDPETTISKSISGLDADGYARLGNTITYSLVVDNPNTLVAAKDVAVRDSLLEDIPTWLSFNNDITLTPSDVVTSGSLLDGTFVIDSIAPSSNVVITYSFEVVDVPLDVSEVTNIAVDTPDLIDVCLPDDPDCSIVTTEVSPETEIDKVVDGLGADGYAQVGETLVYTISVTNSSTVATAYDVPVRDSLLENLPTWLTYNADLVVDPAVATTGDLTSGDFAITTIDPLQTITLTYSVTFTELPSNADTINNIASDNGKLVPICLPISTNCSSVTTPIDGESSVEKFVQDENKNGIAEVGETINYAVRITNSDLASIHNVEVYDSLVASTPTWLTYNDDMAITPTDIAHTGTLATDDLIITEIPGNTEVFITYSFVVNSIPSNAVEIENIITTDGTDTCPDPTSDSCDTVVLPVEGDTIIDKTMTGGDADGVVSTGDVVSYDITVTNNTLATAHNIIVRDSLVENLPTWLSYNGDLTITPDTTLTSGSLASGTFTIDHLDPGASVVISYSFTVNEISDDADSITNIAINTDNDPSTVDPEVCAKSDDCSIVVTPIEPETVITKLVDDVSDGYANIGDSLTYTIEVQNTNKFVSATDVAVRDSLLEAIPAELSFNNDVTVAPASIVTTGDLTTGNFVISEVPADSTVTITYSFVVTDISDSLSSFDNIATDNGSDPTTCAPSSEDCDEVVVLVDPETVIEKSVSGLGADGWANVGDKMVYQIEVTNLSTVVAAQDVIVRDSLLEDLPAWLTYNDDLTITPIDLTISGSLFSGNFTIDEIPANTTVVITYSLTMNDVPDEVTNITNVATDDGNMVSICLPKSEDCAAITTPIDGETSLDKFVEDANLNGIAEIGEELFYTIRLTNPNAAPQENVFVRDTLIEDIASGVVSFMTYNNDMAIDPTSITYTGDLKTGDLVIDEIPGHSEAFITYSVKVVDIPKSLDYITNIATNDTTEVCPDVSSDTCDSELFPAEGDTVITKSVSGIDDGYGNIGDTLKYQIDVTNVSLNPALGVRVRDSLLEDLPTWLTFNDDVLVSPVDTGYGGTLTGGNFVLNEVPAGETVTITYTVTINDIIDTEGVITNVVTDDATNPATIAPETPGTCELDGDCSSVVVNLDPETIISKEVDPGTDIYANVGDTLSYTINVENPNGVASAINVSVRDSLAENIQPWFKYLNDVDVTMDGTPLVMDVDYSGDLRDGTFVINEITPNSVVTIRYSIVILDMPSDVGSVDNIVRDDGNDPTMVCTPSEDCDLTSTPVDADTMVTKSIVGLGSDNLIQTGEVVTYVIEVTNLSSAASAIDVPVRDNLLEDIPTWITFDGIINVDPVTTAYTGDLTLGTFVIDEIPAGETITITYDIVMNSVPTDTAVVNNIATDNGHIDTVCRVDDPDCGETVTLIDGETDVEKFLIEETHDNVAEKGEVLTYDIHVTNSDIVPANDVTIRDSLLEQIGSGEIDWLEYNGDLEVNPSTLTYSGSLLDGTFVIDTVDPGEIVDIMYSVTVKSIPSDVALIPNIATDDGTLVCTDPTSNNCDVVEIPTEGDTNLSKRFYDANDDNLVQVGEQVYYEIAVENYTASDAHNVEIRDGMLENTPIWLRLNNDVTIMPDDLVTTGSLYNGDFMVDTIPAGETIYIRYSVTVLAIPKDEAFLNNNAVDNGLNPDLVCSFGGRNCAEIRVRFDPNTRIDKEVVISGDDEYADVGDVLHYSIDIFNPNKADPAIEVLVRDNLVENTPDYLEFNNDVAVSPAIETTGSLVDVDFTLMSIPADSHVIITYSMTVKRIDENVATIDNIATDNGVLTEICRFTGRNCDEATVNVRPEVDVVKTISGLGDDGYADLGEVLTYELAVTNPHMLLEAQNVLVRDSLFENLPSYVDVVTAPDINPDGILTTGNLANGDYTITSIPANTTVTITYQLALNDIPEAANLTNLATIDGSDPDIVPVCPPGSLDCSSTITPIDGSSDLEKFMVDENGNGIAEIGETLNYEVVIVNQNDTSDTDIEVFDSLVSSNYNWIKYNNDLAFDSSDITYTGSLEDDTMVIDSIPANSQVVMTYSMELIDYPPSDVSLTNIITVDGTEVCGNKLSDDCDYVTTPVTGNVNITKQVSDASGDNVAELGENLNYTITVDNQTDYPTYNVAIRDSMLEQFPDYLSYNRDLKVSSGNIDAYGSVVGGNFILKEVPANTTVYITYSLKVTTIPSSVVSLSNFVTADGSDPNTITDPDVCNSGDDCSSVIATIDPDILDTGIQRHINLVLVLMLITMLALLIRLRYKLK